MARHDAPASVVGEHLAQRLFVGTEEQPVRVAAPDGT
jgi:hypothetical protein